MENLSEQKRNLVVKYKERHPEETNYKVAMYFSKLGLGKSTIYNILTQYEVSGTTERMKGSGRSAKK